MDSDKERPYVVLEGWAEIARFKTCGEALLIQDFMENLHPRRKFDLWLEGDGFMRLREGRRFVDEEQEDRQGAWVKFIRLKGGTKEHGRTKEDLSSD